MESFLLASKSALSNLNSYKRILVVLGNETCDLDSAVCALLEGYLEFSEVNKNIGKEGGTELAVIPVINIPEREFRIKTEVVYYLDRHMIPGNLLTFRDQIDLKTLCEDHSKKLEIVLVDHHCLAESEKYLADSVVEIIDHRPQDASCRWEGKTICIEPVGSCATLIARKILTRRADLLDARLANLLRGPIIIDTCNFSKEADRATATDYEIIDALEKAGSLDSDRTKLYNEILAARTDISKLTPDDLMIRDLKFTAGVPIVGLPMLVEKFLTLDDGINAIRAFAKTKGITVVVVMGLDLKGDQVRRDIAIFSLNRNSLESKIIQALTLSTKPCLELSLTNEISEDENGWRVTHYRQGNLRATRKQVLPIVREAVSTVAHV